MARHPQVPVLGFTCDEDLAELIILLNGHGIRTVSSCQDNRGRQGWDVRRVWVCLRIGGLEPFLNLLSRPAELADRESLSNRMALGQFPPDRAEFERNRMWHYDANVNHHAGTLLPPCISVRFPWTDLDEVVRRLRQA